MLEERALQGPGRHVARHAVLAALVQRVHHLAVDVELQLARGCVADAHRRGFLVARQPVEGQLGHAPLAGEPVHDLHLLRAAGNRAHQPVAPSHRLFVVAGVHHREKRERRVAQPAEAVVPVAHAADELRQRRRRRSDDSAGGRERQRLEDEQRLVDLVVVVAEVRADARPVQPVLLRVAERLLRVDLRGQVAMRREPGQHEGDPLALTEVELRHRRHVLAADRNRSAEAQSVGAGDRDTGIVDASHPRDDVSEVVADDELRSHRHFAVQSFDDAHDVGRLAARRHEVDHADGSGVRLVHRLEDERVAPVAARCSLDLALG